MPDSKFDLGDYVEVKDRIKIFYELFGQGRLVTETVEVVPAGEGYKARVMVKALAYRTPDDPHPGVGHSWLELPGSTPYTKGSEVENAETSAWGRAIGSLGILIDRSIATQNEIDAKAGESAPEPEPVNDDGSLIGTAQVGKPPSDFELRATPQGQVISFRLSDGRRSIKVVAYDALAESLALVKADVLEQRVTCWGIVSDETFRPKGSTKDVTYQVLTLKRISTPTIDLPASIEAESLPLFSDDEEAGIDAALDAA